MHHILIAIGSRHILTEKNQKCKCIAEDQVWSKKINLQIIWLDTNKYFATYQVQVFATGSSEQEVRAAWGQVFTPAPASTSSLWLEIIFLISCNFPPEESQASADFFQLTSRQRRDKYLLVKISWEDFAFFFLLKLALISSHLTNSANSVRTTPFGINISRGPPKTDISSSDLPWWHRHAIHDDKFPGNWTRYADLCIFQKPVFLCTLRNKIYPDKPGQRISINYGLLKSS